MIQLSMSSNECNKIKNGSLRGDKCGILDCKYCIYDDITYANGSIVYNNSMDFGDL